MDSYILTDQQLIFSGTIWYCAQWFKIFRKYSIL